MSSKTSYVETPEMRKAKYNRKQEKHDIFSGVFTNTFGLLLLLLLTYSALTIAFSNQDVTVLPESNNSTSFVNPPIDFSGNASIDESYTSGTTANGSNQNDTVPNKPPENNSQNAVVPLVGNNIETIVPYFVNGMNMVKSNSKSVTNTWKDATNYQNIVEVGNSTVAQSVVQSLMRTFLKEETPNLTYTSREDITAYFPPATQNGCTLSPGDVESASCTEDGNTYKISLKLKPDTNPEYGQGSGAVANIITDNQITDPLPSFIKISNIMRNYQGSSVEAIIDKPTGHILNYYTNLPMILNLTALSMNGEIGLQFEEKWEVAW